MQVVARLLSVISILDDWEHKGSLPLERCWNLWVRRSSFAGSTDRREMGSILYGVIRCCIFLDFCLQDSGISCTNHNRVLLFCLLFPRVGLEEFVFRCDEECVEKLRGKIDTLRMYQKQERLAANIPEDLWDFFLKVWGRSDAVTEWAQENNKVSSVTVLRVNRHRASVDEVLAKVPKAVACDYSLLGVKCLERVNLSGHALYKQGVIEIQNEGSQLVALLCDVQPYQSVLDYCAGAGGKAGCLLDAVQEPIHVTLFDIDVQRLNRARMRLIRSRLDAQCYRICEEEESFKTELFDRVLLDVPCSGSGTWHRTPDRMLRCCAGDIKRYTEVQDSILEKGSRYVKSGGRLIYVTCSLFCEENEERIDLFLQRCVNFQLEDWRPVWNNLENRGLVQGRYDGGLGKFFKTRPCTDSGMDGFFVAILKCVV